MWNNRIMRTLLFISLLLLTAGCCTSGVGQNVITEAADCPWQLSDSGTSWPIKCNYDREVRAWRVFMLTAGHVVDAIMEPLTASHNDGRVLIDGKIVGKHPSEDAGLVEFLSPRKVWPVEIDWNPLALGDRVIVPGYQGMDIWVVEGFAGSDDRCSTPMFVGGSGSPVIDANGKGRAIVVAIRCIRSYTGRTLIYHHCLIVPLHKIKDWVCSELPLK